MATDKKRKNKLVKWANEAIIANDKVYKNGEVLNESYNGQIAAFSVAVAISGLKPAMALYYSDSDKSNIEKKRIVELLASMYDKDDNNTDKLSGGEALFKKVIGANDKEEVDLRRTIIEYAIALKLVIRTFKFKKS